MAAVSKGAAGESITFENVSQHYVTAGGDLPVLIDVDLHIRAGEFVALVGPSGCGKSTLLKIIAGLIPYNKGKVMVGERPPKEGRRDVCFMLQRSVLMPWRSVRQNVMLPFDIVGERGAKVRERVDHLLDLVGLTSSADFNPWELSGGMQQRVALARALALDPGVMLMDEPFGALDEFKREHLNVEVAKMHDDMAKTSVLVTHSIAEAVLMADRVVCLGARPGRVVADVRIDLPRPRTAALINDPRFQELSLEVRAALSGRDGELA